MEELLWWLVLMISAVTAYLLQLRLRRSMRLEAERRRHGTRAEREKQMQYDIFRLREHSRLLQILHGVLPDPHHYRNMQLLEEKRFYLQSQLRESRMNTNAD